MVHFAEDVEIRFVIKCGEIVEVICGGVCEMSPLSGYAT
jgi:hypothetical protein